MYILRTKAIVSHSESSAPQPQCSDLARGLSSLSLLGSPPLAPIRQVALQPSTQPNAAPPTPLPSSSTPVFKSLADRMHSPLTVRPKEPFPVGNCRTDGRANLRSQPGPAPTFVNPPTSGPSAAVSTLAWEAQDYREYVTPEVLSKDEVKTHIIDCTLPIVAVASLNGTPEASDDEGEESKVKAMVKRSQELI